ncbi:NADH-quinone oxidoreductase subunit NuoE [Komagataeibacter intermedius]|uniref:NADH dehydrogenase subunit E n=2 Tax=Komagataeibacter intermedius TaxID=66229 RepID=A0A0N1FMU1_9PROT|nr:NADH-quinone oxidoreductase subunit NuoE [Komagataeibacter intermedius]KPH88175.1 NADH dehydrogenase subunit E [Komagataeibacter intermedius AF2]MCF3635894.1 NADH-quinone oxidoreductase subunit NuoE [Komagataeibacter intermedius]GAN86421.1 NADH dehydrogenase (ubiquinone) 24 kDa subunit [Komagataeibacter intermedius TF2]GBQ68191.1 NADH-quinone oxidoreductase chain E [Komagataeibacter intermedius NRIC 0521]
MSTADASLPARLRAEILGLAAQEPHPRGAAVAALRLVQARFGWVSTGHLCEVAGLLGMSADDLDGIATYFNLLFRRPVGRHVIMLCDSVSCWIMGREPLCAHLCRALGIQPGETTADNTITVLPTVCIGHCDHAPAMLVDSTLHGDVDTACLDHLIDMLRNTP